jgi:hypothetical protein
MADLQIGTEMISHHLSLVIQSGIKPVNITILMSDDMGCARHQGV